MALHFTEISILKSSELLKLFCSFFFLYTICGHCFKNKTENSYFFKIGCNNFAQMYFRRTGKNLLTPKILYLLILYLIKFSYIFYPVLYLVSLCFVYIFKVFLIYVFILHDLYFSLFLIYVYFIL